MGAPRITTVAALRRACSNGVEVWRGPSPAGGEIVAIATGFVTPTANQKTGPMIQLWILDQHTPPHDTVREGEDTSTCGRCPHAGSAWGTCYVRTFDAPLQVWRRWKKGGYPTLPWADMLGLFRDRGLPVRLGAYGDPAMLPYWLCRDLAKAAGGWTGYTHQHKEPWFDSRFRDLLMLSTEDKTDAGPGRTFRILAELTDIQPNEVLCPATDEGRHKATCATCLLCQGASKRAKNVALLAHGKAKTKLLQHLATL